MVIPSLALFISLPILLKSGFNFYLSVLGAIIITFLCYMLTIVILSRFGIEL